MIVDMATPHRTGLRFHGVLLHITSGPTNRVLPVTLVTETRPLNHKRGLLYQAQERLHKFQELRPDGRMSPLPGRLTLPPCHRTPQSGRHLLAVAGGDAPFTASSP